MKLLKGSVSPFVLLAVSLSGAGSSAWAQSGEADAGLKGNITDPSGASAPNALVQLRGPGGEQRVRSDALGNYSFSNVRPGQYSVRFILKGFSVNEQQVSLSSGIATLDARLNIESEAQVVTVEEDAATVTVDPTQNAGAIVLKEKELEALSDDPDELGAQLQALAGPAAGPNGGQIYIDGFTGGTLPPKASIREVRVNGNPFSAEYDRPGFGRIEIFTKPGSDRYRGSAMFSFNDQYLNSRSPLLTQSTRPPYESKNLSFNFGGPIKKNKASFGFDFERRSTDDNAFILAYTLDSNLIPQTVNQVVQTPTVRTNFSPRVDYTINANNTLVARFQHMSSEADNAGIGSFNLASRAYQRNSSENGLQLTETMVLGAKMVNETRFQFRRNNLAEIGDNSQPVISVQSAFTGGGPSTGNSGTLTNLWELTNSTTFTQGRHIFKWGARLRQYFVDDTSLSNFGGTFSFFGAAGPLLDANNLPIAGTQTDLTALERYRRTLLFQSMGFSPDLIRLYGGGASQFTLNAGIPATAVNQLDAGLFFNDDWRVRSNLTVSYGLRYETQTNMSDFTDLAPRIGIAWGIDQKKNSGAKTILRAGVGIFYDRVADSVTLNALRFNGTTQDSFRILNPDFFPTVPSASSLTAGLQPQQVQLVYAGLKAPRNVQSSIGIERQMNKYVKLSVNYIDTRGIHQEITRDINAPINGAFPYGDSQVRMLTESVGETRIRQVVASPNVNYKRLFLFGFYSLSYGRDNLAGTPADPYNLRAEWGPSSFGDIRHRFTVGTSIPLPFKISISPFVSGSSGAPYNITSGVDTNRDGFTAERPALVDLAASECAGGAYKYEPGFGCFNLIPGPGAAALQRNAGRGPAHVSANLRLQRTWSWGERTTSQSGSDRMGGGPGGPGGGGFRGGGGGGGMRGGGAMGGGMMGGGMGGMRGAMGGSGAASGKYSITLSLNAQNVLNHTNYSSPIGDLSSPFFGQSLGVSGGGFGGGGFGGGSGSNTYNRKIDVQLRFSF